MDVDICVDYDDHYDSSVKRKLLILFFVSDSEGLLQYGKCFKSAFVR